LGALVSPDTMASVTATSGRVDVGGLQLEVEVVGSGWPAIVFVAGAGEGSRSCFAATVDALAVVKTGLEAKVKATQVFYSRPGLGASDHPNDQSPRSVAEAAAELHTVLASAGVQAPYVLVGHSIGASIIEAFALRWPAEAAAVVLVDASSMEINMLAPKYAEIVRDGDTGIPFDVVRSATELATDLSADEPPAVPAWVVTSRPGRWLDLPDDVYAGWEPFTREELDERWQAAQARLAERWKATQVTATVGGHRVQVDQPDLVASAVTAAWTTAAADAATTATQRG
jgi:pimeloyl-ACP methyl ester carboxylesterase